MAKQEWQLHCGVNAVASVFAKRPEAVQRLFYTDAAKMQVGAWCRTLAAAKKPYRMLPPEEVAKAAGTVHHGGMVAIATALPIRGFDAAAMQGPAPVVVLDGVGNPQNLGAIARTAAFLGVRHLVLSGDPRQALPSDAAIRVAEGALEHLALWRADDLPAALFALSENFSTLASALAETGIAPGKISREKPVAIVLGNEEAGLSSATIAACTHVVTIPGSGLVQSLNVGAAAAILIENFRPLA
jgi:TrmH RNA methyltransferase